MTPMLTPESVSLRACSACAGEYEDPEQTAWGETIEQKGEEEAEDEEKGDEGAGAGNVKQSASREGFPAREL